MLIKHYIELRGRFAAFNVDANFNEALDGLVFVRTRDIPAKLRERLRAGTQVKKILPKRCLLDLTRLRFAKGAARR